jgi:pimeloyl-ACP methyl ester carboxylesterase
MSALIHPKTITVDGLSVRYAEGGQDGPDAILMSPWPESVYAFEPAWPHLAAAAHIVAIDPPGFGGSDYRQTLMNPKAMGHFILKVADALGLDNPHIVGPDIGTSSVLSAAAADRDRFRGIVVGSGGVAVPLDVAGVLKEWIEAPDLEDRRAQDRRDRPGHHRGLHPVRRDPRRLHVLLRRRSLRRHHSVLQELPRIPSRTRQAAARHPNTGTDRCRSRRSGGAAAVQRQVPP